MRNQGLNKGVFLLAGMVMLIFVGLCRAEDDPFFQDAPKTKDAAKKTSKDTPDEITLKRTSGKTIAGILTPQRMRTGGKPFRINGSSGVIDVGGMSRKVTATINRGRYFIAVDGNDDGKIGRKEIHSVTHRNNTVLVTLADASNEESSGDATDSAVSAKDKPQVNIFVLDDVRIYNRGGKAAFISFDVYPAWGMEGKIDNAKVTLIDANMDGAFRQDGNDAIAVGSKIAVPLKTVHRIGENLYTLAVSEDGTTMSAKKLTDVELAIVQPANPTPLWKGLVLESDDGAFDVIQDGKKGIPAGTYRTTCGAIARGPQAAFITRPPQLTYEIKAGQNNLLRIGLPVHLAFTATFSGGKLNIPPNVFVDGAGGERYRFATPITAQPSIHYMDGKRTLRRDKMEYG